MRIKKEEDKSDWESTGDKGQKTLMVLYFSPAQNSYSKTIMTFVFLQRALIFIPLPVRCAFSLKNK